MSFGLAPFGSAPFGALGDDTIIIIEALTASDTLTTEVVDMLRAQLYARDLITAIHLTNIIEQLQVSDAVDASLVYGVVERLFALDALAAQVSLGLSVAETARLYDRVNELAQFTVTDAADTVDSAIGTRGAMAAITDLLAARDAVYAATRYSLSVLDAAVAVAAMAITHALDITDTAQAQATLVDNIRYFIGLLDAVTADDAVIGAARMTVLVDDSAETTDVLVSGTTFYATIEESLTATLTLAIEGQPYTAIVLNTLNKAVTEYAPYDFNSLAHFNGQTYGVNALGLFSLSGDDDAGTPIAARARLPLLRIAGGKQAQVDSAYLGYSSDGTVQLKTIVTEPTGLKTSRVYQLNTQNADASRSGRIKLGRGVKSAYWSFEISNVLGADFTIDVVEMHVLALSRRI